MSSLLLFASVVCSSILYILQKGKLLLDHVLLDYLFSVSFFVVVVVIFSIHFYWNILYLQYVDYLVYIDDKFF